MITVKDVMIQDVVTIDAGATLLQAAEMMRDANVGMLPVLAGDVLRGIVTDRDLVIRAMTRDVRPSEANVSPSHRAAPSPTGASTRRWRRWPASRSDGFRSSTPAAVSSGW